jgi:Tfp pilus assembly protein PilX
MRGEVRKIAVKRLVRDEKGYILILALLVLVVVGLISGPVLSYMVSGLRAGHVFETGAAELYAADAGVEDAVWRIPNIGLCPGSPTTHYTISDVNGKSVDVTITYVNNTTDTVNYHVESIATSNGTGTKIDAYIVGTSVYGDYSGITNQIITSLGEIDLKGVGVNLTYPEGNGPDDYYTGSWPDTPEEVANFADFYWQYVKDAVPYTSSALDVKNYAAAGIGPFYRNGTLDIVNSGVAGSTLPLNGVVYITGDTTIGQTGKDFTLDLNGQTIFVSSDTAGNKKALIVGDKCTIIGPGAIIAIGDVYFAPKGDVGGNEEPVFVLSVSGTTLLQPSGDFYGAIAGSVEVEVKQGTTPTITYPEDGFGGLIFPGCTAGRFIYSIASWDVSRQ